MICTRCGETLFPANPDGSITDTAWDEERCWPHTDPHLLHIPGTTADAALTLLRRHAARPHRCPDPKQCKTCSSICANAARVLTGRN